MGPEAEFKELEPRLKLMVKTTTLKVLTYF